MSKNKFGFTLIELLITIAVAGVLSTIGLITYASSQKLSRDGRRKSDLKQYQTSLENYANRSSSSSYPVSITAVNIQTLCATLGISGACPDDVDSTKHYSYITDTNGTVYVLWGYLERSAVYWVLCSNGNSGTSTAAPATSACPALTP